ncbi:MAG: hypothetical protein IH843_01185 [Thaumarchaeota archaeon]|nr:hypothetical protein [Nitrososphaerota archaeon]
MLSTRTIIGIVIGGAIIAIGSYALVTSFGLQTVNVDDTFQVGESTSYSFSAPKGSKHYLNITADSFEVFLRSPRGGLQIKDEQFKRELTIEWVHLEDGETKLKVNNTGDSELNISGYLTILTDPILITYHLLVIITGVVIIGFSAGFSVRKPRGF